MKNFLARQRQEGFFTLRIKSSAGRFSTVQLAAVNELAETFGQGVVNLTSRQELSIPFVRREDFDAMENFCAAHELKLSPTGTIFKQVTACQGTQTCPAGIIDSPQTALELERRHGGRELPCKVTCSVTGCPNNCMKVDANDIGIKGAVKPQFIQENCMYCGACARICPVGALEVVRPELWKIDRDKCINCGRCVKVCRKSALRGEVGFKISFAGKIFPPFIGDEETLYRKVDAAVEYFAANAKTRERLGKMLERLGAEDFNERINAVQ